MRAKARSFLRYCVALAVLAFVLSPARAWAWVEWHHIGDNVRLTLASDGSAVVETTSRYDVMRGPIKTFDVQGIDADAKIDADLTIERLAAAPLGTAAPEDSALSASHGHVEPLPKRPDAVYEGQAIRLVMDGEGSKGRAGLARGAYAVTWRYRVDATTTSRWLSREGSRLRLVFQGTTAPEGYDSARLLVVVPSSIPAQSGVAGGTSTPEPPRLAPLPWGSAVAALRRGPGEDELELVRPHVARAEAPRFAIDLDARLLPLAERPDLRPSAPPVVGSKTREHVIWALLGVASALLAYWLVRLGPTRAKREPGVFGLVRTRERAWLAAAVAAGSVVVEVCFGLEWALPLAPLLLLLAFARGASPKAAAWKAGLAVLALVALIAVTFVAMGPCPAASAAARVFALLPALLSLCPDSDRRILTAVERAVAQRTDHELSMRWDEDGAGRLRLMASPLHPLAGFVGFELGKTRAGIASLVRVERGSVAESRLRALWPSAAARRGRSESERAYVLFAPTTKVSTLCRAIVLMGPAFGERRRTQAAVLAERRRARTEGPLSVAWT